MASLQKRGDTWRLLFNFRNKQHSFPVGEVSEVEANGWKGKVELLLMRLKQNLLDLPAGCDIVTFLQHDGKPPSAAPPAREVLPIITIGKLRDEYLDLHAKVLDPRTVADMRGHWKHLVRHLKGEMPAEDLTLATLQKYVLDRVGQGVESATAKKEVITLRTCWNWAVRMSILKGAFPNKGLRFPKGREKAPFMTLAEAEHRIAAGESEEVWESVYLTNDDISELLGHVRRLAETPPWLLPLVCFAAHTGARRGELIRARVTDVDLTAGTALVREKKRRRDVDESTRRVPLTAQLNDVLKEWLARHPGGQSLFASAGSIARSKKRGKTTGHMGKGRATTLAGRVATVHDRDVPPPSALTRNEVHYTFKAALEGTKWAKLSLHALRHSFISICASKGVDQRFIDEWVGHTTEAMRIRYRHLMPSAQRSAIGLAFS